MPKIWQIKFVQEFQSNKDREEKKHVSARDVEKYFNQFPDLQLKEDESTFDFFKRAVEYQTEVRYYIKGILQETHD